MICLKISWKKLAVCVAIPLAVGGLAALLTSNAMDAFGQLRQPPLSPPAWLFPVAWTILYALMGLASYFAADSSEQSRDALMLYAVQLAVNFIWPILFFSIAAYLFALVWLVLLVVLVALNVVAFWRIDKRAGWLMVPYLAWVCFATYLNAGIWYLNR